MTPTELILIITLPVLILLFLAYRNLFKAKSDEQSDYLQNKRSLNISIAQGDIEKIIHYAQLLTKSQHLSLKHAEEILSIIEKLAVQHTVLNETRELLKRKITQLKYGLGYPKL